MADDKKKYESFTSPKGVAKWAHLNQPQTKIGNKTVDPSYSVTVVYNPDDAAYIAFKEMVEAKHAEAFLAEKKANPKKKYKDEGLSNVFGDDTNKDGEPTGLVYAKFKHKAEGERKDKTKWFFKPGLFDAKLKGLAPGIVIYGGSVIRVSYQLKHTPMPTGSFYTSLQLQAVQVLELKSEYTKSGADYGFSSEEGYEGEGEENAFGEQSANVTDEAADAATSTDF